MVLIVAAGTREKGANAFEYVTIWQWPKPQAVAVAQAAAVEVEVAVVVAEERMVYCPVVIYLLIHSLIQM